MQVAFAAKVLSGEIQSSDAYILSKENVSYKDVDTKEYKYMLAVSFGTRGTYSAVILRKIL